MKNSLRFIILFLLISNQLIAISLNFSNSQKNKAALFLLKNLPYYDKINFNRRFFIENIEYSFLAKYLMPWGEKIPEDIFFNYVLPHRVSQEPLELWRKKLFEEIGEKVHKLSMQEAVIYISRWCYQKSIYKPTYPWDSGPLTTMKLGYGRCEEKAILLIDALRSVSIPSRMVFIPAWEHGNGNHAWVEVWINGKWNVLEIAKPVKILNHPWFEASYSLMPAVYTYHSFNKLKNITEKYNPKTCNLRIKSRGKAYISIFNSGMLRLVASTTKDKTVKLGYGSYIVTSLFDNKIAIKLISCNKTYLTEKLDYKNSKIDNQSFILKYPLQLKVKKVNIYDTTVKGREVNKDLKKNLIKNSNIRDMQFEKSLKNFSVKDLVNLDFKKFYQDYKLALKMKRDYYNEKIFINYVLNPRIYFENLKLWREIIYKNLNYVNLSLNKIIDNTFRFLLTFKKINKKDYGPMLGPAELMKSHKYRNNTELKLLAIAIFRTFGIPAKFDISGKFIEVYDNKKWIFLKTPFDNFNKIKDEKICFKNLFNKCKRLKYDKDFTLSFFKDGYFSALRYLDGKFDNNSCCWSIKDIPDKTYFFIQGKRLKNNEVEVKILNNFFSIF